MQRGTTMVEIGITVTLLGLIAGIAFPRLGGYRDRIAVDGAAASTLALLTTARHAALRRATVTAVSIDTATATITVFSGRDTLERRLLGEIHGVRLTSTRDSIAYGSGGMGFGAANTQLVFRRGIAAETVTVSRLGRVRR